MQLTNETLLDAALASYVRVNDNGVTQFNRQVDPQWPTEEWLNIPAEAATHIRALLDGRITMGQIVRYLCEAYSQMQAAREELGAMDAKGGIMADTIAQRFWREAESRGWCSDADDIVGEINTQLRNNGIHWQLEPRVREYEVTVRESYSFEVERTVMVEARNVDDAREQVANFDNADDEDLVDAIRYRVTPTLEDREILDVSS